jgi:hypothetical protein
VIVRATAEIDGRFIEVSTESNGKYRIAVPQPGHYLVRAQPRIANRFSRNEATNAIDAAPQSKGIRVDEVLVERVDFALEEGGLVIVEVRNEAGMPATGNLVCIAKGNVGHATVTQEVETDQRGEARIHGAPTGSVVALARDEKRLVRIQHSQRRGLMVTCVVPDKSQSMMDSVVACDADGYVVSRGLLTYKGQALLLLPFGSVIVTARKGSKEGSVTLNVDNALPGELTLQLAEKAADHK